MDGNPTIEKMKDIEPFKKMAAQINEASFGNVPNCLFVSNPSITRHEIKDSLTNNIAIPITYVVIMDKISKDTEMITCYGKDYGDRDYKPCKMKKRKYQETVDMAYEYVENLPDLSTSEN